MKDHEFAQAVLDTRVVHVSENVTREFMQTAQFDVEDWAERVALHLQARVCSHNLRQTQVRYPADWWEAFKARWFPRWALRRWPVRYEVERIELDAVFPDMPIPDYGDHFLHARTVSLGIED